MFTVSRLGLPGALHRCLATTNPPDSTHSGVRQRTRRVTNWQHGQMALRWAAAASRSRKRRLYRLIVSSIEACRANA